MNPPGTRILIIEDSIVSAVMMEATILRKKPEFQVRIRKSLRGGLEELVAFRPQLILLDLTLPDSPTGVEAIQAIPRFREHASVIAVSGHSDLKEDALQMGANEFMAKGFGEDPTSFIDRINHHLVQ